MVEKGNKKWRATMADFLDLPREIMLDLPKLTVIGNLQCTLENHRGVTEYSADRIKVAVNGGEMVIKGRDLTIVCLTDADLAIEGKIEAAEYRL